MSLLDWILLGLIAGFMASNIVRGSGQGLLLDLVLGDTRHVLETAQAPPASLNHYIEAQAVSPPKSSSPSKFGD